MTRLIDTMNADDLHDAQELVDAALFGWRYGGAVNDAQEYAPMQKREIDAALESLKVKTGLTPKEQGE